MRFTALILAVFLPLSACGTKGPLTLPPKPGAASPASQTPPATNDKPAREAVR